MSSNSTTLSEDTARIERELEISTGLQAEPENWPLGSQYLRIQTHADNLESSIWAALHPMEPFVSRNVRYRIELGELANQRCFVWAAAGARSWSLNEGVNELEFPAIDGPLRLWGRAWGPVGTVIEMVMGEQRQCS